MFLIRILGSGGMLLSHVVLARGLGVTGFGEYAQAIAWLQVLCVFGKLGLDNTSLRYVSEYVTKGESGNLRGFVRASTRMSFLISSLLMVGVVAAVVANWNRIGDNLASCLILASFMIPMISLRQIQEASLRGVGQLLESQISTAIWPFSLCLLATLVWQTSPTGLSSPVATFLHLASIAIASVLVFYYQRRSTLRLTTVGAEVSCRRQWFGTAAAFVMAELLIVLKTRVCVAMAGIMLGRDSAGLYAAMERFADITMLGSQSLALVIAPQFASLFAAGKYPEMRKLMWHGQFLGLAFTLPVALAVAGFGNLIFLLLGSDYQGGWSVLMALLASACITAFAGPSAYVLQMTGRERTMLAITAACAASNIAFSLLLMPRFNILGLGLAQVAASLVWTVSLRLCLRQHPAWQNLSTETMTMDEALETKEAA